MLVILFYVRLHRLFFEDTFSFSLNLRVNKERPVQALALYEAQHSTD